MSGALPNTDFNAINIKSNQATQVSISDSGRTFKRQIAGQDGLLLVVFQL